MIRKLDVSQNNEIHISSFLQNLEETDSKLLSLRELDIRDCRNVTLKDIMKASSRFPNCVIRENAVLANMSADEIRRYIDVIANAPMSLD